MKNLILGATIALVSFFSVTGSAASRYYYDLQKFHAILDSKACEAALGLSTLDAIELTKVDDVNRLLSYRLKTDNGKCTVDVVLSFEDGFSPNYKVTSVGPKVCN